MGFFSDVVDTIAKPISGFFGGGGTTVTTGQTAKQDIRVDVKPSTAVEVNVPPTDLSPIARGIREGYTEFSQAVGEYGQVLSQGVQSYGEQLARGQLALTSAAERGTQVEAEKVLQDKQQFAWIKQTGKTVGGYALVITGAVIFIWAVSRN